VIRTRVLWVTTGSIGPALESALAMTVSWASLRSPPVVIYLRPVAPGGEQHHEASCAAGSATIQTTATGTDRRGQRAGDASGRAMPLAPVEYIPDGRLDVGYAIAQPDFPRCWRVYDPLTDLGIAGSLRWRNRRCHP
jgi:hypothetical protein